MQLRFSLPNEILRSISEGTSVHALCFEYAHTCICAQTHTPTHTHTSGFVVLERKVAEQIPKIPLKSMLDFCQTFGKTCKTTSAN